MVHTNLQNNNKCETLNRKHFCLIYQVNQYFLTNLSPTQLISIFETIIIRKTDIDINESI